MKIALLDVQTKNTAINKTMAGGYGTSSDYSRNSRSLCIRFLKAAKKKGVRIPLIEFAYLGRIFEDRGHQAVVSYSDRTPDADLYLIYISLAEFNQELAAARRIREADKAARIGFIGTLPTVYPHIFAEHADFVLSGESENFFLNYSGDYMKLEGVIQAGTLQDLDTLPFPKWSLFEMGKFVHDPFFGENPVYPIIGSKGCPFSCSYYCAYPIIAGAKLRYRKIENIIEELKFLKREYNARAVLFRDANFSVDVERAKELCRRITRERLDIRWACETHLACLDKGLVDLMHESGARAVTVGIESRNKEVIRESRRKDAQEEHIQAMAAYCEQKGIKVMAGYIFGHPKDDAASIRQTIEYSKRLNTSFAQFVISTPYPGTQYYRDMENYLTTRDWERFDTYTLVFKHPNFSVAELERLKKEAYTDYYFRPRWIAKFLRSKVNDIFDGR